MIFDEKYCSDDVHTLRIGGERVWSILGEYEHRTASIACENLEKHVISMIFFSIFWSFWVHFRDRVRAPRDLRTAVFQNPGGVGWATGAWDKLFLILMIAIFVGLFLQMYQKMAC